MQILPVIDILHGVVVRGIAGRRSTYLPNKSILTDSHNPSVVVRVLQEKFGLTDFYVADLDAIQSREFNQCIMAELSQGPGDILADCGVRTVDDVGKLLDLGVNKVIVGLETLPDLSTAAAMVSRFGSEALVFSLDLKNAVPISRNPEWADASPIQICTQMADVGFCQFVVLDLASVGTASGTPTLNLCGQLRNLFADSRIITGGGIRGIGDVRAAKAVGVDAVLIASALHDGSITAEQVSS